MHTWGDSLHRHVLIGLTLLAVATRANAQDEPLPVSVSTVVQRDVAAGQTFVGTVVARRTSQIGSPVADQVIAFPVNEGDRVEAGQLLASLRTKTLEIDLDAARAELEFRKQTLAELENGSRPEEIAQARARMLGAEALLTYAKTRLERYQRLFKTDTAAEDEMNEAISSYDSAEQAKLEAEAALKLAVDGPRKERIAQARAQVDTQQAEIRRIEDEIDKHRIVAPFSGYVVAEHTEVGQWLAAGDPVVDLAELDTVDVQVPVLGDCLRHLRVGTTARVEIGALRGEALTGQIALIVPQADVRSRTFPVKVRLQNRKAGGSVLIKAGLFARVTLPVGRQVKATLVPKDALVLGGPKPTVYVVDPGEAGADSGRARAVPVNLGVASEGLIQVTGPVKPGQQVVVRGNERLMTGQAVTIAARLMPEQYGPGTPATTSRASKAE